MQLVFIVFEFSLELSNLQQSTVLANSLCNILWKAGGEERAIVTL